MLLKSQLCSAEAVTDTDYANLVFLVNTSAQAESQLHSLEQQPEALAF